MSLPEDYSNALQFNFIIRFLHSIRYKNLKKICREHFTNEKITVFEIGAGIGKTYDVLNEIFSIEYYGIESVHSWYFDLHKKHENKKNFSLFQGDVYEFDYTSLPDINLVVALETFEHIHTSRIQKILNDLRELNACHYFFSVPAEIGPSILIKNIASFLMGYNRHEEYTWRETFLASMYQLDLIPKHSGGHLGFDWRSFYSTLKHNFERVTLIHSPFALIPSFAATSIHFHCTL